MAESRTLLPLLLLLLVASNVAGRKVGGWMQLKNVEENKDVQELGRYCVGEYNRRRDNGGGAAALVFSRVVEAERQVVSGIKYRLKISAAATGAPMTFEAVVVVKPWLHSKDLLQFTPSHSRFTTSE